MGLNNYSDRLVALEGKCEKLAAESKALLACAEEAENRRFGESEIQPKDH